MENPVKKAIQPPTGRKSLLNGSALACIAGLAALATVYDRAGLFAPAAAQSLSSGTSDSTSATKPTASRAAASGASASGAAAKPAASVPVAAAQPVAAAAPAVAPASGAKIADFQTMEQLQKAGVKRCLQVAQAVGQATMVGTAEYAAASTWNSKQPDNRFSVSMIGQKFNSADASVKNGISGVFSSPTSEGKCDAAAIQIIPTVEPCSKTEALILEKGKSLGNLAGVPIFQNAANAQVMLIPATNNSCVLVALSTVYTE